LPLYPSARSGRARLREERFDVAAVVVNQFLHAEWVHAQVVIASLQGIATKSVVVQPGAADHKNPENIAILVVKALEQLAPLAIFVQCIENQKADLGKFLRQNRVAISL